MNRHFLKILPEYFEAVCSGEKKAELRLNDRDFKKGDYLMLMELDGKTFKPTGKWVQVVVTHFFQDARLALQNGFCMLSIEVSIARNSALELEVDRWMSQNK